MRRWLRIGCGLKVSRVRKVNTGAVAGLSVNCNVFVKLWACPGNGRSCKLNARLSSQSARCINNPLKQADLEGRTCAQPNAVAPHSFEGGGSLGLLAHVYIRLPWTSSPSSNREQLLQNRHLIGNPLLAAAFR
jgi:hypothetical protein